VGNKLLEIGVGLSLCPSINYLYGAALSWMNMHTSSVKQGN